MYAKCLLLLVCVVQAVDTYSVQMSAGVVPCYASKAECTPACKQGWMSSVLSTDCQLVNDTMFVMSLCNTTTFGTNSYYMCTPNTNMFTDLKHSVLLYAGVILGLLVLIGVLCCCGVCAVCANLFKAKPLKISPTK